MFLRIPILLIIIFISCTAAAQPKIVQRIFLVGDAGELDNGKHPVCDWLKQNVDWNDSSNTIVYLGDNIYPLGMPSEGSKSYATAKSIIDYQVSVVKDKNAKAFFVPGNHDWKRGKEGGLQQIQNASDYIESLQLPNVQHLPSGGCPGPVEVKLADNILLVCMDSEWWLEQNEKPGIESDCDYKNEEQVIMALKDIINSNPDKMIIIAMHHPFHSHGEHGGYYTFKQHIFPFTDLSDNLYIPLPVLGSAYPIARGVFGAVQDIKNPLYRNLIEKTEELIKNHPNVVHVAGHEHTLQLFKEDSVTYVVSGAGSKHTRVKKAANSIFAESERGFAVIEVSDDGSSDVKFYSAEQSKDLQQPIFTFALPHLSNAEEVATTQKKIVESFPDSVTVVAEPGFKAGGFKKFLLGPNYRDEWATPVKVKVFDIDKVLGGLKPLRRGGGHQSRSLRLEDSTGKQWVLRSVQKFVTDAALPPDLRGTIAKDVVSDGVSASYPYAALSVPPFADAAGVPHATPMLFYVPDDPRLGKFRTDFANLLCLLEEREPGGYKKTSSTDDMVKELQKDNDNSIDQHEILNARLLDMFMMDFDRHEDQWRWTYNKTDKGKEFFALPRDRDQPFFVSKGVLPSFARQNYISPQIQGFRSHAINIRTYNFNGKNFDRAFLNELSEDDWKKMTDEFLAKMTDTVIEQALHQQPPELLRYSNSKIIQKLKERKKYFADEMEVYYKFISKVVSVTGSNKNELFNVVRNEDGSVTVAVFKINKEGEKSDQMYERKFDPAVTKEIRLYGLDGDDKFVFSGNNSTIKVRVIGGGGKDVFESDATAPAGKTLVYDLKKEDNQFSGNDNLRKKLSDDPSVNSYQRLSYKYNLRIPFLSASYNVDDGIYLGASMRFINQGFRKTPYQTMHSIAISHSLSTKAYNIKYNADFISVFGKTDILIRSELKAPNNVTNFFGYGNETVFDKSQPGKIRYYRTRYAVADVALLLRKNLGKTFSINAGPAFQYYSIDTDNNAGRFITKTNANGLDSATLYENKFWLGGQAGFNIDNRNNKIIPTRGVNWQTSFKAMKGLNNGIAKNYSQLNSDFTIYISPPGNTNFVLAERFGAGINFGNYEFFQAQYLSGTENLRGYRKYRFAGTSMLYNNLELRIKVADFRTYLFPGAIGLLGFFDTGKVWVKNDPTSAWHKGYGGGIWIAPMKKVVISASYAASKEGGLPLISFGWMY
ncbi:MAG: metallophosphoesterase [Chitinophagaceae bacterium]